MPTKKPRVTFTISQEKLDMVDTYRFDNKFKNQTQAILSLIEKSLSDFESKKAPPYSGEALKLAKDYDGRMDDWGRKQVRSTADIEIARCADRPLAEQELDKVIYITNYYPHPASAGTGQEDIGSRPEELELTKRPPRGTSYVIHVDGDSMEPTYHHGDKLFIQAKEEIEPGQIGIFFMDGKQWVKELGDGELISHNPGYNPRPMTEDIRCQGLVLGVCDDSYFE